MKILLINGSPSEDGNTSHMLKFLMKKFEAAGLATEFYQAGGKPVMGCLGCGQCFNQPGKCVTKDWVMDLYPKMKEADAIIIGSPTYFADVTAETKAIIDRVGYMAMGEGGALKRKVGAAVVPVRRSGAIHVLDSIQHFYLIHGMIVPGSTYWNMSLARDPGNFEKDAEGVKTMENLADNIIWLMGKIAG
jgi:multimeric flavodoxin WrbA